MDSILEELKKITNEKNILLNEPMKNHTTFKTGGNADIVVMPETVEELSRILTLDIEKTIIGNGSNLIVKDGGIRGLVIITKNLNSIKKDGNLLEVEAGVYLSKIANFAKDNSLKGFEFASGIPGTLGGAVYMNAGAYGGEMKDVIIETTYIDNENQFKKINNEEHEFGKRKSFFTNKDYVIISSKIKLENGDSNEIMAKMKELREARNSKQPVNMPSAGSIFKRPEGFFAGKLIEDSGLKGYKIGGAMVSNLHAGFIVNDGGATSTDIIRLIEYIQKVVYENYKVNLETEVKVIGED